MKYSLRLCMQSDGRIIWLNQMKGERISYEGHITSEAIPSATFSDSSVMLELEGGTNRATTLQFAS